MQNLYFMTICSQPVAFYISHAQKFYPTHIFQTMIRKIMMKSSPCKTYISRPFQASLAKAPCKIIPFANNQSYFISVVLKNSIHGSNTYLISHISYIISHILYFKTICSQPVAFYISRAQKFYP